MREGKSEGWGRDGESEKKENEKETIKRKILK